MGIKIQQNPTKSNKIEIDNKGPTKWVCQDQKYKFIVLQDSEIYVNYPTLIGNIQNYSML